MFEGSLENEPFASGSVVNRSDFWFECSEHDEGSYGFRGTVTIHQEPTFKMADVFFDVPSVELPFDLEGEASCGGSVTAPDAPKTTPLTPSKRECLSSTGAVIDECTEVVDIMITVAASTAEAVIEATIMGDPLGVSVDMFSGLEPMSGVRCDYQFGCSGLWFQDQNSSGQSFDLGDEWSITVEGGRLTMVAPDLGEVDGAAALVGVGGVSTEGGAAIPDAPIILDRFVIVVETPAGYTRRVFDVADLSTALAR